MCTPSNYAADLITDRLSDLDSDVLFRLNAPSREPSAVSDLILKFSREEGGEFVLGEVEEFKKFRVVVCTCSSASIPYSMGLPLGHYSHVFIDEAGQASEPEIMIPIKTVCDDRTVVVLSGDSKQLGPVIRSPVALELGLSASFLDRLTANPAYDEKTSHGRTFVVP